MKMLEKTTIKWQILFIFFDNENVDLHIPISYLPETPSRTQTIRNAVRDLIASDSSEYENRIIFINGCDMWLKN